MISEPGIAPAVRAVGDGALAQHPPASDRATHAGAIGAAALGGLLAFGLVCLELARPHGLYGVTQYDDGVYFGSALELVAGKLPYKDFVFLQPPGITLLMAPLAALVHDSRHALGIARVLTGLVAGASAVLAGMLVRHRGVPASLIAALALGVFPPAYAADHTLMLEPYLVLFCLIGASLLFRGDELASGLRVGLAGLSFGFAGTFKIWALIPATAALLCVARERPRQALRFLLAVLIGFGLPCAPFLLAAPHNFFHQVLATQLQRGAATATPVVERLAALSGVAYLSAGIGLGRHSPYPLIVTGVLASLIVAGNLAPAIRTRLKGLEAFVLLALIASIGALFLPRQFFDHYAYFSAVFLALALGIGAGRGWALAKAWSASTPSRSGQGRLLGLFAGCSVLVVLAGSAAIATSEARYDKHEIVNAGDPGPVIARAIAPGSCVLSDAASLLILANRFSTVSAQCPAILDSSGTWLSYDPTHLPPGKAPAQPAIVALWSNAFSKASYVVLSGPKTFRIPWTKALHVQFAAQFSREVLGGANLYRATARSS